MRGQIDVVGAKIGAPTDTQETGFVVKLGRAGNVVDVVTILNGRALGVSQRVDGTILAFGFLGGSTNLGNGTVAVSPGANAAWWATMKSN